MFVRTAGERDLPAIQTLLVETWHATYDPIYGAKRVEEITREWHSLPALTARLMTPHSELIVADDGVALGGMAYAAAGDDGKRVQLHQLYVRPAMQGRGIGGLLLDDILDSFPDAEIVRVEVEERNDRAVKFYLTQGFLQSGRTPNCGGGTSAIPALILEKGLGRERGA